MSGWWLVTYLALWVLVVVLCLFVLGILRHIGFSGHPTAADEPLSPDLEHDGPSIGSFMPPLTFDTVNGFGAISLAELIHQSKVLVVFMSPLCKGCQETVDPLNAIADDTAARVYPVVLMRADEQACDAFLRLFPLRMPVVCDAGRLATRGFDAHRTPFGLLYDEEGVLVRKGTFEFGRDDLRALLGDLDAPSSSRERMFPSVPRDILARAEGG